MSTSREFNSETSKVLLAQKKRNSLTKKFRKFNLIFLLATFTPMLSVGLFNIAVDPYDAFNTSNFFGINHSKPNRENNDRLFKALDIIRTKPITIILGSSRTKLGLDPTHPALNSQPPAYNLAINGPNTYELLRYLQHAIANQKELKEVIFGVDFFMFNSSLKNQPSFSESRLEKQHMTIQDFINSAFSLDVLSASSETIIASINKPDKHNAYGENGFVPDINLNKAATERRFKGGINLYFDLHSDYQFSQQYLSDFKSIVELCKQHGITLKVLISPSHATQWEAVRATGRWQTFEEWKREIVKIVPIWDFSGYNSITTEPISNNMKNYTDNSHYTKEIGDLVLNRVLSYQREKVPADFGILLTEKNIESHLAKIRADREAWAKNNSQEVKLVQDIKRELEDQENDSK